MTNKVVSLADHKREKHHKREKQRIVGYKLVNKQVVPCYDLHEWAIWFGKAKRSLGRTMIGPFEVCTSFLGIDYNWEATGDPVVFETMIFVKDEEGVRHGGDVPILGCMESFFGYMVRYTTWDAAMTGHNMVCQQMKDRISRGNPKANKRRMHALWERNYERLQTTKLAPRPGLRIVGSS